MFVFEKGFENKTFENLKLKFLPMLILSNFFINF